MASFIQPQVCACLCECVCVFCVRAFVRSCVFANLIQTSSNRSGDDCTWTASEVVSLLETVKLPPHEAAAVILHARQTHAADSGGIDWLAAMRAMGGSE